VIRGETRISRSRRQIDCIQLRPTRCKPLPDTLKAIAEADLITLGPGSLFTSVIPNLLVQGIPKAIEESRAVKAYFVNLMWQPGETIQFRASDHIRAIEKHAKRKLVDYAVINTSKISPVLRKRYALDKVQPVENDVDELRAMGMKIVTADLVQKTSRVRHDPAAAAAVAMELAREGRRRRIADAK
jgi:uncharacterized cofD-like protein